MVRCSVRLRKSLDVTVWSHDCVGLCPVAEHKSSVTGQRAAVKISTSDGAVNRGKTGQWANVHSCSSFCWTGQGSEWLWVWFCSWRCIKVLKCIMGDVINMTVVSVMAKLIVLAFFSAYSVFLITNVENSLAIFIYIYIYIYILLPVLFIYLWK